LLEEPEDARGAGVFEVMEGDHQARILLSALSAPPHGLRGGRLLEQLPKPVFQQFDGLLQGAELSNPDYRDGSAQVKRWGTQYFHAIDGTIPGNKASG